MQETEDAARAEWRAVADRLRAKFRKLSELMDGAENEVLAYMAFPKSHWSQIHSTNPIERLNREIKRRTNVVSIFPNEVAIDLPSPRVPAVKDTPEFVRHTAALRRALAQAA